MMPDLIFFFMFTSSTGADALLCSAACSTEHLCVVSCNYFDYTYYGVLHQAGERDKVQFNLQRNSIGTKNKPGRGGRSPQKFNLCRKIPMIACCDLPRAATKGGADAYWPRGEVESFALFDGFVCLF